MRSFPSSKRSHHQRPKGHLCFPAVKSMVFPANRFLLNGSGFFHVYGGKLLWICKGVCSKGGQLCHGDEHQEYTAKVAIYVCKRLLGEGAGQCFGLFESIRSKGRRPELARETELLIAASSPPVPLICVLVLIMPLPFALPWPSNAGLDFPGSEAFAWSGTQFFQGLRTEGFWGQSVWLYPKTPSSHLTLAFYLCDNHCAYPVQAQPWMGAA